MVEYSKEINSDDPSFDLQLTPLSDRLKSRSRELSAVEE